MLAEEFIDGREFTVALLGGRPLLVEEIEIQVEPRIVGFRAKWDSGSAEYDGTLLVFTPDITSDQRDEMMTLAVRVWDAIGMRDYARVDFRMDAEGRVLRPRGEPESRHQCRVGLSAIAGGGEHFLPRFHRDADRERARAFLTGPYHTTHQRPRERA